MYVVIFRARVRQLGPDYTAVGERMHQLAFAEFGCLGFHSAVEGGVELTLSYWPNLESIAAWKAHPEHLVAQERGRQQWYSFYSIEVAEVRRQYSFGEEAPRAD